MLCYNSHGVHCVAARQASDTDSLPSRRKRHRLHRKAPRERSPPDAEPPQPEAPAEPAQHSGRRRPADAQLSSDEAAVSGRHIRRPALPAVSFHASLARPLRHRHDALSSFVAPVGTLTLLRLSLKRVQQHAMRVPCSKLSQLRRGRAGFRHGQPPRSQASKALQEKAARAQSAVREAAETRGTSCARSARGACCARCASCARSARCASTSRTAPS